ncbi:hypothetical protein Arub01_50170 [Actinomadura rubrobrunea]|uniref:Uncharacterized protein n=1 Tax=Actinomadura rubrobrunea TaxID=115335 RepID=A0A9W6Q1K8_9ACTN|nr:hypothetical protein [Actinomadura rubrobrunea]GLW66773.1 hypothetical protein Arub01_50170 [Actinomadura rubrobrunea]
MKQPPAWWAALTGDPVGERLGIDWRAPDHWEPADELGDGDERVHDASGTMSVEHLDDDDLRLREGKALVGTGPAAARRGTGYEVEAAWYLDPSEPDRLWCALGSFYPAWLWIPVEPTADGVAEALEGVFPRPALRRADLTSFARGFLGFRYEVLVPDVHEGTFVEINGPDLDRYFTLVQFVEPQSWGSAHLDDPLPDDAGLAAPLDMLAADRDSGRKRQRLGRVPSMTWRTLHSRSYLSFEIHTRDIVCAAVRYRPSPKPHQAVVRRLNEEHEESFPVDLPLDVVGALTGFDYCGEDDLVDPDELDVDAHVAGALRIRAALWHGDLRRTLRLGEYADRPEPELRRRLVEIAGWYNHRWLLQELALTETDPDLLARIEERLDRPEEDAFNAFGDYFGDGPVMVDAAGNAVETWDDRDGEDGP